MQEDLNGGEAVPAEEAQIQKSLKERLQESREKIAVARQKAMQARLVGKAAVSAISATVQTAPVWVPVLAGAMLVTTLFITSTSAFMVLGRTDNADGCYGIGSNQTIASFSNGTNEENLENTFAWLTTTNLKFNDNKPLTVKQAIGIIGNIIHESGGNPAREQGNFTQDSTKTNEDLIAMGDVGGFGVGMIQFDVSNRTKLAQYAKDKGKDWRDLSTQLEFLDDYYLSEPYTNGLMRSHGFLDDGDNTIEHYVKTFESSAERAGIPALEGRYAAAKEFASKYGGGVSGNSSLNRAIKSSTNGTNNKSGGSCLVSDGSGNVDVSADVQGAVDLAMLISLPESDKNHYASVLGGSRDKAKPEYVTAKDKAQELGGKDPQDIWSSCDRVVATILKNTVDSEIPWGATNSQWDYLVSSSKWERYDNPKDRRPGDIIITPGGGTGSVGHIAFYVGQKDGRDIVVEGSYGVGATGWYPVQHDWAYGESSFQDLTGREFTAFHYKG